MDIFEELENSTPIQKEAAGGTKIKRDVVVIRSTPSNTSTLYVPNEVLENYGVPRLFRYGTFLFGQGNPGDRIHTIFFADKEEKDFLVNNSSFIEDNFYALQFDGGAKFSGNKVMTGLHLKDGVYLSEVIQAGPTSHAGNGFGIKIGEPKRRGDELEWVHTFSEETTD